MQIRDAEIEDYEAFARLKPELGDHDPIPPQREWWDSRGETTLIAENAGQVVGYGYYELFDEVLYVRNVVSAPAARRTGVGRALMTAMASLGQARGAKSWRLNVKDDNLPAIRLYESLGFSVEHATHILGFEWRSVAGLESRQELSARPVRPEEDGVMERAYQLLPGFLDRRRRSGVKLFSFAPSADGRGLVCFDPSFPGAYPLIASDEPSARALFEAMHEERLPHEAAEAWRRDGLQLVVEDQPRLAEILLSRGGSLRFRVLHMRAPLG